MCNSLLPVHLSRQRIRNATHQGTARDTASVHFRPSITRMDVLILTSHQRIALMTICYLQVPLRPHKHQSASTDAIFQDPYISTTFLSTSSSLPLHSLIPRLLQVQAGGRTSISAFDLTVAYSQIL